MRPATVTPRHKASAWPYRGSLRAFFNPLLGLALTGCVEAAGPTGDAMVRDSAGVRIVEYAGAPAADAPFAFSPEPVYSYGGGSGDYPFARIWTGRLLPGGGVVVSDAGNGEVVLLAPDGSSSEILARRGEGPGEVGMVVSMFALPGDRDRLLRSTPDEVVLLPAWLRGGLAHGLHGPFRPRHRGG